MAHNVKIPISVAKEIAKKYGYDQVMVYARKVDTPEKQGGEHLTTYGVNKEHCNAMARIASFLMREIMGWIKDKE